MAICGGPEGHRFHPNHRTDHLRQNHARTQKKIQTDLKKIIKKFSFFLIHVFDVRNTGIHYAFFVAGPQPHFTETTVNTNKEAKGGRVLPLT